MVTVEDVALLRAIAECDSERLDDMAQILYETHRLDGREDALAAAFGVAVRMQFPEGCRPADVIRLVADTRIMAGPDGDRVQPLPMEFTTRAVLDEPRMGGLFGADIAAYTHLMVCRFLASSHRLRDPDAFIREVETVLGAPEEGDRSGDE